MRPTYSLSISKVVDYQGLSKDESKRGKSTYIAVLDFVILGLLNYLEDLFDSRGDVCAGAANLDNVLRSEIASLSTNLDGQCLVLANDPICVLVITYSE